MNYFFDKQQAAFPLPFLLSWAVFWETDLLKRCCHTSKPPHLWYHSEWLGKLNNRGLLLSMAGDLARNWMWWNFMSECGKNWKRGRKKVGSKKKKKNWKRNSKASFRAWTTGTFCQTRQKVSLWRCYVDVTRLNGWIHLTFFFPVGLQQFPHKPSNRSHFIPPPSITCVSRNFYRERAKLLASQLRFVQMMISDPLLYIPRPD